MAHVRLYIDPKSVQICKKLAKNRVTIGFTRKKLTDTKKTHNNLDLFWVQLDPFEL